MKPILLLILISFVFSVNEARANSCKQVLAPSVSPWSEIESQLSQAKTLKELSSIEIGNFSMVQENLSRQERALQSTMTLAHQNGINYSPLEQILEKIKTAIATKSLNYADYWMLHYAMQEATDFDFDLKAENMPKLDENSIRYVLEKLADPKFDLSQIETDSKTENRVRKSLALMHLYTDFQNPRFSEKKRAQVLGNERVPLPFFQRGFDIVEMNNLARSSRIRPVEVISGVYETRNGKTVYTVPIIDARPMGVGKDASDHDFNHLGFEVSAKATRDLGEVLFEGSENLPIENQMVIHVIYFKAWHEWGINLSAFESGTQWNLLLNANSLRADMTNPHVLGGDPNIVKSVPAIESTIAFLRKKNLPNFWE